MASSGIRLGAWDYLRWGHIRPIIGKEHGGEVVAAKIIVYADEDEEYFAFISKEAYSALKDWMKYREKEYVKGRSKPRHPGSGLEDLQTGLEMTKTNLTHYQNTTLP
jgi:hypothetical protein